MKKTILICYLLFFIAAPSFGDLCGGGFTEPYACERGGSHGFFTCPAAGELTSKVCSIFPRLNELETKNRDIYQRLIIVEKELAVHNDNEKHTLSEEVEQQGTNEERILKLEKDVGEIKKLLMDSKENQKHTDEL